ncbi:hypothetical protein QZH41_011799, partial [Actinostola sp. cb2023]
FLLHTIGYESLGCWSISRSVSDTIPSVEGRDDDLDGLYWERVQTVLKCAWAAKNLGYKVFAIRKSGECLTSVNASKVYQRDGTSAECHGGEGGHRAMDVYKLKGELPEVVEFEGDIILTKLQQAMSAPIPFGDVANDAIWKKVDDKWPERTIPYFIHPKFQNHQLARKLLAGIKPWQQKTCINFIPKKNHRDWVELVREKNPLSRRCASAIGHNGGKQQMRLGDLCPAGSVIHEWGHSIGLWHTQSRSDRDEYVQVLWKHILPGWQSQFEKRSIDTLGVTYDYNSIMHYGKNFFGMLSKDKSRILTTIKTKEPAYQDKIGQRRFLSKGDVLFVNKMYGCPGNVTDDSIYYVPLPVSLYDSIYYVPLPVSLYDSIYYVPLPVSLYDSIYYVPLPVSLYDSIYYVPLPGASYNPTEGAFKWSDGTSIRFNAWKKGEPRFGMDCAILFNRHYWGTDQCLMARSSICKKELRDYVLPKVLETDQSEVRWYAGAWGECSVTCGGGQRSRKTFCAGKSGNVHYSKCS